MLLYLPTYDSISVNTNVPRLKCVLNSRDLDTIKLPSNEFHALSPDLSPSNLSVHPCSFRKWHQ